MTNQELNRDVKRLWKKVQKTDVLCEWKMLEIKTEFLRLYNADREFEVFNRTSILIILVMNRKYNFRPHHSLGLSINESKF